MKVLASAKVGRKTNSIKLTAIKKAIFFTAHASLSLVELERVRPNWIIFETYFKKRYNAKLSFSKVLKISKG
jgi:hypothetical protein